MSFRELQGAYRRTHANHRDNEAAHYSPVMHLSYFGVAQSTYNDNFVNYRMVRESTNRVLHNDIDREFREAYTQRRAVEPFYSVHPSGTERHVPMEMMRQRLEHQIEAARATGSLENARYRNFLRATAEDIGVDLRRFNGYN